MGADWIKMRTDLYRDPKVSAMADHLMDGRSLMARYVNQHTQASLNVTRNVTRNAVIGALLSVWGVMRHRGKKIDADLVLKDASLDVLDDVADLPGFGRAMARVGWAMESGNDVIFPDFFESHNVEPEPEKKSKAAERQARYRERLASQSNADVTHNGDVTRDVTLRSREEERRVSKSKSKSPLSPSEIETLFEGVDPKVVADFKTLRKSKRAPVTETAVNGIRREAAKAGLSLEGAMRICCEKGWQGFRAEWVMEQGATRANAQPKQSRQSAIFEILANDHRYANTASRVAGARHTPGLPAARAALPGLRSSTGDDPDDLDGLDADFSDQGHR